MDIILIMLILGSLVGVGKAIQEIRKKREERSELKERLGNEYEELIQMRKNKSKK